MAPEGDMTSDVPPPLGFTNWLGNVFFHAQRNPSRIDEKVTVLYSTAVTLCFYHLQHNMETFSTVLLYWYSSPFKTRVTVMNVGSCLIVESRMVFRTVPQFYINTLKTAL